jgi:purine-binding chemotaxis protein CheW
MSIGFWIWVAMAEGKPAAENRVELACLGLRGQVYGVDVHQVREIVRGQEVTPLPKAPRLIEGVIDLRGVVVPVVDLGRALGGEALGNSPEARIAVLEVDGLRFGLRVQAAVDVLSLPAEAVGATPELASQAGYEAVRAVVRREQDSPILVLSLENLLESVYRSAPAGETS